MKRRKLYVVCLNCEKLNAEADSIAEAAQFRRCPQCGAENTIKTRPPGKQKRQVGGLPRRKYLDPETLQKFRDWVKDQAIRRKSKRAWTDYVIVEILSLSGLRPGELAATTEHPQRYLRIGDLFLDGEPELEVRDGKGHVSRVVKISHALATKIRAYIADFRINAPPSAPLFEGCTGEPLIYHTLLDKIRRLGRDFGLVDTQGQPRRLKPHMLRHSYAVRFLEESDNNVEQLQDILGHANIETTMVYAATTDHRQRRNVEKMS